MDRTKAIEELEKVHDNIKGTERAIANIESSEYYRFWNKLHKRAHDIEIQTKCLAYWKRRFNKLLYNLTYKIS